MTESPTKVFVSGQRLFVRGPYELRTTLASITGAHWEATARAWSYPRSPYSAADLATAIGTAGFDEAALELLAEYSRQVEAQRFKFAETELEPLPFDTPTKPWRHQLAGVRFAAALPAALWRMGLGTGKTGAALNLIRLLEWRRVLVVAPASVVPNWVTQGAIHAPKLVVTALRNGSSVQRAAKAKTALALGTLERPAVVVVNYEAAWRAAFASVAEKAGLDAVILDEGHRIKSPSGRASIFFARLGKLVPRRLVLSGTPMPHSPLDAYAVFRFLDPGIFGTSYAAFRSKYARMGGFQGRQVLGYQNMDDFAKRIARITFDVGREVLELPEATHIDRTFALPPEAATIYRKLAKEYIAELDASGVVTTTNSLARLLRLRQVTSGHVGLDLDPDKADADGRIEREVREIHTKKRDLLEEVLEECGGEPIVVFAQFKHDLKQIHEAAKRAGYSSSELSGSRNELAKWQAGESTVLAVQCQSGSEGIDLTRARYCVIFSLGYSLGTYVQMLARVHRPGQKLPVTYIHLIAEGTVDRHVRRALEARNVVIEDVAEAVRRSISGGIEQSEEEESGDE